MTHSYLMSLRHPKPLEGHSVHLWLEATSEDIWRRVGRPEQDPECSPHPDRMDARIRQFNEGREERTPSRRVQVLGRGQFSAHLTPFSQFHMPVHPPVCSTTALAGPPSSPLAWMTSVPQNRRCLLLSSAELRCHGWALLQSWLRLVLVTGRLSPGGDRRGRVSPAPHHHHHGSQGRQGREEPSFVCPCVQS